MKIIERIYKGLKILNKYTGDICVEHYVIYCGDDDIEITDKDKEKLEKLGWYKGYYGYQIFV